MNAKTLVPLIVALVLGGAAAKIGRDMMVKGRQGAAPATRPTKVVVAREDLAPGATIREGDVALKEGHADGGNGGAFEAPADVIGRVVVVQVLKGQAIFDGQLAARGTAGGAQAMIPPGMRAVTLEVNEFSGLAGLLTPGCRVDVLQTIRETGQSSDRPVTISRTIVENVRVLAVGKRVSAVGSEPEQLARSVTLLATREQAEAVDLASHLGQPRLVLRNSQDGATAAGRGVSLAELRGERPAAGRDLLTESVGRMVASVQAAAVEAAAAAGRRPAAAAKVVAVEPRVREIQVIRAGASTSVRVPLEPVRAEAGGADGLKGVGAD